MCVCVSSQGRPVSGCVVGLSGKLIFVIFKQSKKGIVPCNDKLLQGNEHRVCIDKHVIRIGMNMRSV